MEKSVVISGEASETDTEEEGSDIRKIPLKAHSVQGSVITGEDSESEDENTGSISSAISASNQIPQTQNLHSEGGCNTLLHKKLRECNVQLYNDIEHLCNEVVSEANRTITITDENLLKSQISMQGALSAIKSLSNNSLLVKSKLQTLLSAKFIPKINIPHKSEN